MTGRSGFRIGHEQHTMSHPHAQIAFHIVTDFDFVSIGRPAQPRPPLPDDIGLVQFLADKIDQITITGCRQTEPSPLPGDPGSDAPPVKQGQVQRKCQRKQREKLQPRPSAAEDTRSAAMRR